MNQICCNYDPISRKSNCYNGKAQDFRSSIRHVAKQVQQVMLNYLNQQGNEDKFEKRYEEEEEESRSYDFSSLDLSDYGFIILMCLFICGFIIYCIWWIRRPRPAIRGGGEEEADQGFTFRRPQY